MNLIQKLNFSFLLCIFPLLVFGNMAKPWVDGSQHSVLFGSSNAVVKREIIDIRLIKEPVDQYYYAEYKIKYYIYSDEKQTLPLVFLALGISNEKEIKINNRPASIQKLNFEKNDYSFIEKKKDGMFLKYSEDSEIIVNPEELIYFSANLAKGENVIEVKYDAFLQYNTFGFIRNYELEYSLYPSKFWKSFGPIEVNLKIDDDAEITESNLGDFDIKDNLAKWIIKSGNHENIKITISEKTSVFSKVLMFIDPLGIAFLGLIGLFLINLKLLRRNAKTYVFVLGIILVPILFYVIYFLSYDLINLSLGKKHTKHGYIFFIVFTYPFLLLFYWLVMWQIRKRIKIQN
ncbi:hypothetical protein [Chryseobacterium sp. FH1]|uniref:hypothetical protein n=1 Tax=Chryseobacterium sp. FH1 TaxID=1233951 RepID=UPI0004E43E37|nr:hypothetical protein [Chryseobacterium sp. FH1]KFC18484.1 hypothetical protein IO90_18445 [Chryseobacterium sp. FH1]